MTGFYRFSMTTSNAGKSSWRGISSLITVARRSTTPLYQQIYVSFRTKIMNGELRAGEAVPSTRQLSRELRISRLPVLNAYAQLFAEGHFETRIGSGTFVAKTIRTQTRSGELTRKRPATRVRSISVSAMALPKFERPSWAERLGPFQVGQPELKSFPIQIWSRLLARYSRELRVSALQYGSPMGLEALRELLAAYLRTSRGVRCGTEQIMIVNGSQQALDLVTRVLLDPGAAAWVEEPGYWLVHHVLASAGCEPAPVPVDSDGLSVAAGMKLKSNARVAFVSPSHQYPLGVTMGATRRFQLLEWAHKTESWIVEDDYDSEYRYDTMPIASLQGLDVNSRVIYTGSFSKVLFPALRLGYIVIPSDLVERFAAVRQAIDICPSHAAQAVLAAFIREGHFARHIRKMRKLYEERRRVLINEIEAQFGSSCEIVGAAAGMHVVLLFGNDVHDTDIAAAAIRRKLLVSPLSLSYMGHAARQGLVLGFGNSPSTFIPAAVRVLAEVVQSREFAGN
jgi:GntR family transcriptional regulator/MocR family aminotransferase